MVLKPIWSCSQAARRSSTREASISVAMSASMKRMAWKLPMGCPKATRSWAYLTDSSSAPWAMPVAWAAMPTRPSSSVRRAMAKPLFSSPSRFSFGTRQSCSETSAVAVALMPIFFSSRVTFQPGKLVSTMKALMPLGPFPGSVRA